MTLIDDLGHRLPPAAAVQRRLWSADPEGWARLSEPHTRPLFHAVLDAAGAGHGTRLLDVGCGTGLLLALARERGADVVGLDVAPALLGIAAERVPDAELHVADLQTLPFHDHAFDAVTAINALQFAEDPPAAIRDAARVLRPDGRLCVGLFAAPERAESTAVHLALSRLSPPSRSEEHAPYALSEGDNLAAALAGAGLRIADSGEVECVWAYASVGEAVRGLIGSAGGTRAVEDAGEDVTREAIRGAVDPFTDPATGAVQMRNVFRWVLAIKRAEGAH